MHLSFRVVLAVVAALTASMAMKIAAMTMNACKYSTSALMKCENCVVDGAALRILSEFYCCLSDEDLGAEERLKYLNTRCMTEVLTVLSSFRTERMSAESGLERIAVVSWVPGTEPN
ncbi:hypothetical protein EV702DRAFT_1267578 [Suillus placidus]|uniref:Uncharacterized protein n=1 Tax=Suillus placidus TaxID=48579 RepID=A0A9P7D528_9AGAM|nr:hypothetical protein EV702DRAFT_1267578 [Suillus placidus]